MNNVEAVPAYLQAARTFALTQSVIVGSGGTPSVAAPSQRGSGRAKSEKCAKRSGGDDPRPDLADDSRWWHYLLVHAWLEDGDQADGAFAALHGVRCAGARLLVQANGALRIVAGNQYDGGEEEWERDRWELLRYREAIAGWLKTIADVEHEVEERKAARGRQLVAA